MIIVVASITAILTVPLTGRSLAPLARLALCRVWMVWLSIGLQFVITLVPNFPNWLGQPVHIFTFALSAVFLWSNRRLPGAFLVGLGAALNLAAIAANSGTMPASMWAWKTAGFPTLTGQFENSNVVNNARLAWLGDVFAVPKGWPFANVFSLGDVIIVIAVGYLAHTWCRRAEVAVPSESGAARLLATAD
ncbi:MAG: DUF5317 family protein [Ilumatobacteraceae bacterium]